MNKEEKKRNITMVLFYVGSQVVNLKSTSSGQLLGHTLISHYFSFMCSMALLSMPKIGSWKLDDLVKDPTEKEFQDFLESITTKVAQLETRRGNLMQRL